ncbi:hypothetical protein B0I33_102108 [Prauserella shujinwangii]|uniref:Ig-like domain-containing protein n=1 Tax=Prauserella shujinwangii TaxID=1453103 RepID=A0A2T0M077_9PSEU|nr:hypothetical protein [Prauserella shujinwangii]PRX49992.1 hypothetical protein B0I33_102108 [Prauserella shujinwangii]
MRIRQLGSVVALALSVTVAPAALGAGAQAVAACPEVGNVYYSISNSSRSWIKTNLRSDYLRGPGTITYNKTTTSTVNASVSGTTSAEAGVVFAKASVSLSVTVGASYSKSDSWSYSATVPSGKTKRLQQYKEGRKFTATKTRIVAPCDVRTVWKRTFNAPVKNAVYKWQLDS